MRSVFGTSASTLRPTQTSRHVSPSGRICFSVSPVLIEPIALNIGHFELLSVLLATSEVNLVPRF